MAKKAEANGKVTEPIVLKVQYAALDGIVRALNDLGDQRFDTLADTVRVHNLGKPIRDRIREREELRKAIIQPYLTNGARSVPKADLPAVATKVRELWVQEIEVEITGPPLDLSHYLKVEEGEEPRVNPKPNTLTDLLFHGLVTV